MKNKLIFALILFLFIIQTPIKADFQSEEQQTIATTQKLMKATVKITDNISSASGFYISPHVILTSEHVIHKATSSQVKFSFKDERECTGAIGYREEGVIDLALITTDCTGTPLTLATTSTEGQTVIVLGNPSGFDFTVSKGTLGAIRDKWERIQYDARVNYGSSGGVLANLSGEVVGVVSEKSLLDPYIGLAVPYNKIQLFLNRSGIDGNN